MSEIYKLTPIHQWHQQHGANFILEAGWKRVESYGNPDEEVSWVRAAVGICDATPLTKIDCQGKDLVSFLTRILAQVSVPEPGRYSRGRLWGEELYCEIHVARLTAGRALVFGAPEAREALMARFSRSAQEFECVHLTDLTSAFGAIHLAGPRSAEVLKTVCPLRLDRGGLLSGLCAQAPVVRVNAMVMREDLMGLMSYLILVSRDYGEYVWKSLMSVGAKHQIRQFGLTAERRLRRGTTDVAAVQ